MRIHVLSSLPLAILTAGALAPGFSQTQATDRNTSGAPLSSEEAAFDVLHYDLELEVDPSARSIAGRLTMRARLVHPTQRIALALDSALTVTAVTDAGTGAALPFEREGGRITITLAGGGRAPEPPAEFAIAIDYGGTPRVAPNPPWNGGFTWAETADGSPWIATSCQAEGADLWWPCKDHPSDEAESMDLHVTVPAPLVVASNGRLVSVDEAEGKRTYHWHVSTPINNYGVALNIAPYETIEADYESTCGDTFKVTYWVLPENLEQGQKLFPQFLEHMRFFEELFGPYPFRADKYGVAETPHLGMEHQSIIAYGNGYRENKWGYDWLHHHELSHEWWANLVTAENWKDFWLHEGFGTYTQALYVERLHGSAAYREVMAGHRRGLRNEHPVAPREDRTTTEMYFSTDGRVDNDVYYKGACVLHTLRWLIGRKAFFESMRRMAYPDPALEQTTDGSACRFVTTDDFKEIAERISKRDLGWFFDVYLHQPRLPELVQEREGDELRLTWKVPDGLAFPMPIELRIGADSQRVELADGTAVVTLPEGVEAEIDPLGWVLRAR
ncbi:MAG: M1 family peptidase [Planctomycetota bacterium]|nr:MAG: M1 family peptidase [Planctomycetota bacterium]